MNRTVLAALAALATMTVAAQARPDGGGSVTQFCGDRVCMGGSQVAARKRVRTRRYDAPRSRPARTMVARVAAQVVAHPAGCPRVAFCGCGVSAHPSVYGRPVAAGGLAKASNWLHLPRAEPGPGMVVVTPGATHVFLILKMLRPGVALAYDPNSGGHLTRVHERRIGGGSVRNPHARHAWAR